VSDGPSYRGGLARIATAGLIWGSIALFSRQVGTSPFVIVFWRVAFAGATVAAYLLWKRRLGEFVALSTRRKLALAGVGALLALNWVFFFGALQLTDVAVAVLLGYLGPILVMTFAPLVTREPFDRRVVLPLLIALAGTVIIVGPRGLQLAGGTHLLGAALAFASAFTYAVLVLSAKRLLRGIPPVIYMLGEDVAAALVLLPVIVFLPGPATTVEWGALATLGIVHTAATGFLFLSGLRAVRTDHAAVLTYAEPVSAVVFAALFLGEAITVATIVGGLLVVLAGVRVARMEPAPALEVPVPVLETESDAREVPQ
jgi:drug/metabolite transporter (DMT)-like permease